MSGRCSGVQERLHEFAPQAVYIHCYAHNLNLALVDCVKGVADAREFFLLLEALCVHINNKSTCSIHKQAKKKKLHPDRQICQLQRLSDTRWACHQSAVAAISYSFDALLETLKRFLVDLIILKLLKLLVYCKR